MHMEIARRTLETLQIKSECPILYSASFMFYRTYIIHYLIHMYHSLRFEVQWTK